MERQTPFVRTVSSELSMFEENLLLVIWDSCEKGKDMPMGKNNMIIKQWLSDEKRMASLVNGCLFSGKQIFKKEHLKREDGVQGVILKTVDGKETTIERYRDIMMTSDDGTRIVILACENQEEIHYGMTIRSMLYDAVSYTEQVRTLQRVHREEKDLRGSAEFLSGLKKEDLLCPVITIIFYYGEEEWDGKRDLHGLLGLDREEYQIFKEYVPNYRLNLINPAEIEDLSGFEESLQMVFGMLRYRKDSSALKNYIDQNRKYFSSVDEETYRAAKMMLGADSHWKDIRSEEDGEMNMCKALEDLRQEGIDAGVELGTLHFIEAFQEIGKTYEETKKKLQEKFNLTEEDAEQKMKRCWK